MLSTAQVPTSASAGVELTSSVRMSKFAGLGHLHLLIEVVVIEPSGKGGCLCQVVRVDARANW